MIISVKKAPRLAASLVNLVDTYRKKKPPKFEDMFSVEKFIIIGYHTLSGGYRPIEILVPCKK